MTKKEKISAFAYKTGKHIENIVYGEMELMALRNKELEGKVLQWYVKTKDEEFAKYFGIESKRNGKTGV